MNDPRNVIDEFKGVPQEVIVQELDKRGVRLEIAVENNLRDYNMGTIVRTANAFGVRTVHIVGRKQWNRRGAMMTETYLMVVHHRTIDEFVAAMRHDKRTIIAVDNIEGAQTLTETHFPKNCVMLFGAEGPGLSSDIIAVADKTVAIEQKGSTRSINVGVAAGIVMYEWVRQHAG